MSLPHHRITAACSQSQSSSPVPPSPGRASDPAAENGPAPRPPARAHGRQIAIGVVRILAARGLSISLSLVAWALVARALGPSPLGMIQFLIAIFAYVAFIGDPGLTTLGTREYVQAPRPAKTVSSVTGTRLLLATLTVLFCLVAAALIPGTSDQRLAFIVLSVGQIAFAANFKWVLRSQQRSSSLAVIEVAQAIAFLVTAVVLVHGPGDLVPAALVATVGPWTEAVLSFLLTAPRQWDMPHIGAETIGLLRRGLPLGVATLAIAIYYGVDTVLLGVFRTSKEVGWYTSAYSLVLPWLTLASVVGWLAMPKLAELWVKDEGATPALLRDLSRGMLLIAVPLATGTTVFAPLLIRTIYGNSFAEAALPLSILIWSTVTVYANAPFGFLMLARRQDRRYMQVGVTGAIFNILSNFVFIPTLGILGASMTTMATEILVFSSIIWITREQSLAPLLAALRTAVPVALITGLAAFPVRNLLIGLPIALAVYVASALLIGGIRGRALGSLLREASATVR